MMTIRYLALFLWLAVPAAAYGVYAAIGLPHMIVGYTFENNGAPFDLTVKRHYVTCTFIGPYGAHTRPAEDGRCAWVRFFKSKEAAQ
ncbi:hypothetical protein B7H23_03365 [Notoacmeibacter marinus]|uniref:Uncharacterized protein n=1 Tax=Notoacmeibacter marinus TaxID=1876515 RepID=A0A231V1B8_9HYPH|nr:hypothetical protein [Notoacmeibacter marinus]OXT01988.1 hypothetical protein B7H23_03365 [Notoacmeibacter marinus]